MKDLLTDDERAFLDRHGYVAPFRLATGDEVRMLCEQAGLYAGADDTMVDIVDVVDGLHGRPDASALINRSVLTDKLEQLHGPGFAIWHSRCWIKRGGGRQPTGLPWHVDDKSWMSDGVIAGTFGSTSVWLALTDATERGGCLAVVDGSHREDWDFDRWFAHQMNGHLPQRVTDPEFMRSIELDPDRVVRIPLEAGQFLMFSDRLVHGSDYNADDQDRMGLAIRSVDRAHASLIKGRSLTPGHARGEPRAV